MDRIQPRPSFTLFPADEHPSSTFPYKQHTVAVADTGQIAGTNHSSNSNHNNPEQPLLLRSGRKVWRLESGLDQDTDRLYQLIRNGHGKENLELMESLLKQGSVKVNKKDNNGKTALHYAAIERENPHTTAKLLEFGADIDTCNVRDEMNGNGIMLQVSKILEQKAIHSSLIRFSASLN